MYVLYVCMSVCLFNFLHNCSSDGDFTLGGCVAEDLRKCSGVYEVVWVSGSRESGKEIGLFMNRHGTGTALAGGSLRTQGSVVLSVKWFG